MNAAATRPALRSIEGRIPAHDIDVEAASLSSAIIDPSKFEVLRELEPEMFFHEPHRRVFEAMRALHAANTPIDLVTIGNWLKDRERIAQVGGMQGLMELVNAPAVVPIEHLASHAKIIRDKWRIRQMGAVCQRASAETYFDYGDAQTFLDRVANDVRAIAELGDREAMESNLDALKRMVKRIREAHARGTHVVGIPTGLALYDYFTQGIHSRHLHVVAARPSMGKSSLGFNIANNVAERGIGVLVISIEMPRDEVIECIMASRARIEGMSIRSGKLSETEWSRLYNESQRLAQLPLWIDDASVITVDGIAARVRETMRLTSGTKTALGLVVVDYLQKVSVATAVSTKERRMGNRQEEVASIAKGLKGIAKRTGIPVLALAQLNRANEMAGKKVQRPTMANLRESGDIEAEADVVTLLHRESYYAKDQPDDGVAELIIDKARRGRTGVVKVHFTREHTRFDNLATEDEHGQN